MRLFLLLFSVFSAVHGFGYRLPTTSIPVFYSLKIQPDILNGSFSGEVTIHVDVKDLTDSIVFHSSNLTITEVYLDQKVEDVEFNLEPKFDIIEVFYANRTLIAPGNHIVHVKYYGSLLNKTLGFFRVESYHDDFSQEPDYIAATDFQPSNARGAFPCFDEPALKAQFQLTIIAPNSNYTALSNMRTIDTFETSIGVVYKFETSIHLSPYLIAFAIVTGYSSTENTSTIAGKDILFRINAIDASPRKNAASMHFVMKAVEVLSNYTQIPYPSSKIDLIEYSRVRWATENWGLVMTVNGFLTPSYRFSLREIARILSHELSHFWFGDLVTNNWWDDIWIQEAFATFMGSKVEDHIWNRNKSLGMVDKDIRELNAIYTNDQTKDTISVVRYCDAPLDCYKNFDDVTYFKGAQIIRMIEMVMGEDKFQEAMQTFLKKFTYKSATTNDLISIIETLEPLKDMRGFLESFLYQNRFPYIDVEDDEMTDSFILTQFSSGFEQNDTEIPLGYKWSIPITYITDSNNSVEKTWFYKEMESLAIPKQGSNWIKLNYRQLGYYRTRYSESLWDRIIEDIEVLDDPEMLHLVTEAVRQYEFKMITCEIPLRLLFSAPLYYNTYEAGLDLGDEIMGLMYKFLDNHERETGKTIHRYLFENPRTSSTRTSRSVEDIASEDDFLAALDAANSDPAEYTVSSLDETTPLSIDDYIQNKLNISLASRSAQTVDTFSSGSTTLSPKINGTNDPDLLRCVEWVKVNLEPKLKPTPDKNYFFYW